MIKVTVVYPQEPGTRFDHDYYRDRHMPMVQARLARFVAGCQLFFHSVEAFQAAFAPHMVEIMGDMPNYTDRQPPVQINQIVV